VDITGLIRKLLRSREVIRCGLGTRQWRELTLAYLRFRKLQFPYVVGFRDATSLCIADHSELTTVWHVYFGLEYTLRRQYQTIIDVGAHIGAFSVWIATKCPSAKVLAIEPFPSTFVQLQANIDRNTLTNRVKCVSFAASSTDGVLQFDSSPEIHSYSRSSVLTIQPFQSIDIEARSLQHLLETSGFDRVDLLKIDIEGDEYDLLLNSKVEVLRRCREIVVEYHGLNDARFPQQPADIMKRMLEIGYEMQTP